MESSGTQPVLMNRSHMTDKCPFCGSEVKSEIVKRLKAQGFTVTLCEMEIIQRFEELQSRVFTLEQTVDRIDGRTRDVSPRIGCAD